MLFSFNLLLLTVVSQFLQKLKNSRLKLAIPTGAPVTVGNDAIEMLPVVTHETINDLSKESKEAIYLLGSFAH